MPTLYTWKRKRSEGDELNLVDQRAQAGDAVTLFEENGWVYKSAVLDRLDHDTAYSRSMQAMRRRSSDGPATELRRAIYCRVV